MSTNGPGKTYAYGERPEDENKNHEVAATPASERDEDPSPGRADAAADGERREEERAEPVDRRPPAVKARDAMIKRITANRADPEHSTEHVQTEDELAALLRSAANPPMTLDSGDGEDGDGDRPARPDPARNPQSRSKDEDGDEPQTYELRLAGNRVETVKSRLDLLALAGLDADEAEGMPDRALVRLAQKNRSAELYLDDARKVAKDARLAAASPTRPHQDGDDDDAGQDEDPETSGRHPSKVAPDRKEKVKKAVEKIQLGNEEEAAEALLEVVSDAVAESRVQDRRESAGQQAQTALNAFADANKDIFADPDMSASLMARATKAAHEELAKAFNVTPQQVAEAYPDYHQLGAALGEAHRTGAKVRPVGELLNNVADQVRERFGAPRPKPTEDSPGRVTVRNNGLNDRLMHKRGLPQAPMRASNPNIIPAAPPTSDADKVASIVRNANKQRGFKVGARA